MGIADNIRAATGSALALATRWTVDSDEDVPFADMQDALTKGGLAEPTEDKPRAMFHDPYAVMDWGGWRQRPSALTYDTLRQMTVSNTVIAAIIQLRVQQVAQFARPQQGKYDKGFRVILRDRRGKRNMSKVEQNRATEIENMLATTGYLLPEERSYDRDTFRTFLKKEVRDILTYDQMCFEKLRDRRGKVSRFQALPSETIRPAVSDVEHMDPAEVRNRVAYVQVYEESVIAEFGPDDVAWEVMNPRSDLRVNGFGFAPSEQIVRLITSWLYGFDYNTRFFTQGSAIKGVLNLKGAIPDRQLRAFRRMWYTMVSGAQNSWKTPILNSEDIQWVNMHSSNRDMEFNSWLSWLTKMICAVYGIDPIEINFIFDGGGGGGGGSSMFSSRPNQAEVTESKDKGLRPLIDHLTDALNHHVVWDLAEDFEFSFVGLDALAEDKERAAKQAEVKTVKTINQIREEMDEDPLPGKLGDVILDPNYLQWVQMQEGGEGGEEEGGPPMAMPGGGNVPGSDDDDGDDVDDNEDDEDAGEEPEEGQTGQQQALAASLALTRQTDILRKAYDGSD